RGSRLASSTSWKAVSPHDKGVGGREPPLRGVRRCRGSSPSPPWETLALTLPPPPFGKLSAAGDR
ncbi:MAG: hypothetical protein U9R11_05875, partial [Chloroflexota bacterium]|nr:hypothetical protein [Chloroflexota bacterium]